MLGVLQFVERGGVVGMRLQLATSSTAAWTTARRRAQADYDDEQNDDADHVGEHVEKRVLPRHVGKFIFNDSCHLPLPRICWAIVPLRISAPLCFNSRSNSSRRCSPSAPTFSSTTGRQ